MICAALSSFFVTDVERRAEEQLLFDMAERGRRLTAFKEAIAGKVFVEVEPGEWRYVAPELALMPRPQRRLERRGEFGIPT